ncbi:MAG: protein kinase [Chloroflexi bacterium]|nr:protein kinase [Chloroflexota bacterium]
MTLEPGTLLYKRYKIAEVIAQGGMGAIYKATDESLGVVVAVKENLFTNEEFSRQFHREATILAGLRHTHLPRVTDHFVLPSQGQYLVMDFIDGEDLRHRIQRLGRISEEETLQIGAAICDALAYLHHRQPPILHRDVKPGNIKITPKGQIFLVDFGLAKIQQAGQQTTIGAQSLTPGFAPPEQYGQGTDQRSDIYALAATLYHALTGAVPEDGLSRLMGSARLTPVRTRNPQISARTAAAVERGMSIDPSGRFQEAGEFKQALMDVSGQVKRGVQEPAETLVASPRPSGPAAPPPATPEALHQVPSPQPAAMRKSPPWLWIGIVTAFILAGIGLGGFWFSRQNQAAKPTQIQAPLTSTLPAAVLVATHPLPSPTPKPLPSPTIPVLPSATPASEPTAIPASPTPAATPTGGGAGQLAFASNRIGIPQVWVMNIDGSSPHQITQMPDGACQPDWSPDGQRLVFVSPCSGKQEVYKGSSLFTIGADGSGLISLATMPGGDFEPAWSPDGSQIAFTSVRDGRSHIYLYSLADNQVQRLSPAPVYDRQPAWSPDGQRLAFITSRSGQAQVWTMQADGSQQQEFSLLDRGAAMLPAWSKDGQVILFSQGSSLPGLVAKGIADHFNETPLAEKVRPVYSVKYSSDGAWLVFETVADGNPELFMMTSLGTNLTRLTNDAGADFQPAWRP